MFKFKFKLILVMILLGFTALFLHNAWFYSPLKGYDAGIHTIYTNIITFEHRIPTPKDTPESYNPPTFYFLSGKLAKLFTPLFNNNFLEALKGWQIMIALLLPLAGYLWYDLYRFLNPKNYSNGLFFLFWLLSVPVINLMMPMYTIEMPQLIIGSFIIWFFIKYFLKKPNLSMAIYLGIFCGVILSFRIMSVSLLISLGIMICLLAFLKKISFKKMLVINFVFTVITLLIGGQYYYFYRNQGVFNSGENVVENRKTPFFQRQPKSFYVDTFFRTSMRTPIRPYFPNRFIPIFYSTFWGDYWNYYRQRRYPLSPEEEIKYPINKEKVSKERLNMLAWQNRINIIPTIIIILGTLTIIVRSIKNFVRRKNLNYQQTSEGFLAIFFSLAFLLFFYTNIEFPNTYKGDTIKASYILYAIPCLIYFAVKYLQSLKKYKFIYYSLLSIIIISILFNLNFAFY